MNERAVGHVVGIMYVKTKKAHQATSQKKPPSRAVIVHTRSSEGTHYKQQRFM